MSDRLTGADRMIFYAMIGCAVVVAGIYFKSVADAPVKTEKIFEARVVGLEYVKNRPRRRSRTKCHIDFSTDEKLYKFVVSKSRCSGLMLGKKYQVRLILKEHFSGDFIDFETVSKQQEKPFAASSSY
ncbi:MAG: hypothetical protein V4691_00130 [Pseudomonadota bacterium]